MIKGGYILQPRLWDKSKAAHLPPATRELWFYLLRNVSHTDSDKGKRGERFFNLEEIQDDLSWKVGYRVMKYSKPQLTKALRRLREELMIATPKATHGIHVTIINFDTYQNPKNYEGNGEGTTKETRKKREGNANKNEKNERMKEEYNREEGVNAPPPKKRFVVPEKQEVADFFAADGFTVEEAGKFYYHYDANGWMAGRVKMKSWESAAKKWMANAKNYSGGNRGLQQGDSTGKQWNGTLGYQQPLNEHNVQRVIDFIANDDRFE